MLQLCFQSAAMALHLSQAKRQGQDSADSLIRPYSQFYDECIRSSVKICFLLPFANTIKVKQTLIFVSSSYICIDYCCLIDSLSKIILILKTLLKYFRFYFQPSADVSSKFGSRFFHCLRSNALYLYSLVLLNDQVRHRTEQCSIKSSIYYNN